MAGCVSQMSDRYRSRSGSSLFHKMDTSLILMWITAMYVCLLSDKGVDARVHLLYWNTTNTDTFNNADHIMFVNQGDKLDIICPDYSDSDVPPADWEYYTIYMVEKINYDECIIGNTTLVRKLIQCQDPESLSKFTLSIRDVQPVQGMPDFKVGDYYLMSTSGGRKFNMNNQYKGACESHHMKIMMRVRSPDTDDDNDNHNNDNNNNGNDQTRRPPTVRTTQTTRSSSSSTSTTTTTKEPTAKPHDGDILPGSDGFPDDNTVIRASDGPSMNSGVIDDSSIDSGCFPLHQSSQTTSITALVIVAFIVSALLLRR